MFNIEMDQLLGVITVDDDDGTLAWAEASSLGLPPGDWPDFIAAVRTADDGKSAVGSLFSRMSSSDAGHEYSTRSGQRLFVFND